MKILTDVMEMKRSSLVLPQTGYELDREEMCYVEGGDRFLGVSCSRSFCISLASWVPLSAKTGGMGLGALGSLAMQIPYISNLFTPLISGLTSVLAAIPVWGWVAIAAIAVITLTILGAAVHAGGMGKGYEFGFRIETNWWGLPTGAEFVSRYV